MRRAEMRGRAKLNSLLEGQEAVCGQVVVGAGLNQGPFGYERNPGCDGRQARPADSKRVA